VIVVNPATLERLESVVGDVLQAAGDWLDVKPSERVSGPHIVPLAQLEMLIQPSVKARVRRHQREAVRVPAVVDGDVPEVLLGVLLQPKFNGATLKPQAGSLPVAPLKSSPSERGGGSGRFRHRAVAAAPT
jgi:hypothetical protein